MPVNPPAPPPPATARAAVTLRKNAVLVAFIVGEAVGVILTMVIWAILR